MKKINDILFTKKSICRIMIGLILSFLIFAICCIIQFIIYLIPKSPEEKARRKLYEEEQARRRAADKQTQRKTDEEQARQQAEAWSRYEGEQTRKRTEKEHSWHNAEEEQTMRHDTVSEEIQKCFALFELPYSATLDDIKKKYKIMMRVFHPDKHSTDDTLKEYANQKAKELNNAFNTLKTKHFTT